MSSISKLFGIIKQFTYLIKGESQSAKTNIFLEIISVVIFVVIVFTSKFALAGEQMAHHGLALFGVIIIGIAVIVGFFIYCVLYHVKRPQ